MTLFLEFEYIFVKCKTASVGRHYSHVSNCNFTFSNFPLLVGVSVLMCTSFRGLSYS